MGGKEKERKDVLVKWRGQDRVMGHEEVGKTIWYISSFFFDLW